LHLHTKKSLHNGPEASAWRSHLYKSLLGNRYLVSAIIDRFVNDDVGVLFPATYSWLPYWAHHWLSNSHLIKPFFQRIGVPYSRPLNYLDYPVGSMFWARPQALKPLLQANWSYEDFPPEAGQNDGTVAHVMERSIVTIARHQQYSFIEFDYQAGSFRRNWSRKSLYQYAGRTPDDLKARIRHADVVSFDIFDTLLTRTVLTPDALQQLTGWLLSQQRPELTDFFETRKHSEDLARKRKNYLGDVDLNEIYRAFPRTDAWSETNIERAKQLEMDLERRSFCIRADIVDALRYAKSVGKRLIAVSDTYFSRAFINSLLDSFGLLHLFDELYLSSERGKRKDRGDMWEFLLSAEQLNSRRMLHIGDNEHSDAQLPGDRRIETFHVMSPVTLMVHSGFPIPAHRNWTTDIALGSVAAKFFNSPFLRNGRFQPFALSAPKQFGYFVFGPLLFGFFSWLLTHPASKVLDHLYFLSREGYFLFKLYQKLQSLPGITAPSASYLYASRRSAIGAAQALKFDPAEIMFGSGFQGTIAKLLSTRIGLRLPEEFELDKTEVLLPEDSSYIEEVLRILEPYIVENAQQELQALRQYCAENGLTSNKRIGLVDVGYSGSIQNALQTVLGRGMAGLYLATVEHVNRVEEGDGFAWGCFADRESFATTRCAALQHCRILESFLTAPHGQVLRFESQNERAVPVFKREGYSQAAFPSLIEIYEGINSYFDDLIQSFGPEVLLLAPDLGDSQIPLHALVEHRILLSDRIADDLYLEDEYCGNAELAAGNLATDKMLQFQVAV
jgi:predicted HAD superfamily hydrolase